MTLLAQATETGGGIPIATYYPPAQQFQNFGQVLGLFSQNILVVAGVIFFVLIIVAGFMLVSNAGSQDAQAMQKWKGLLTNAVIGFVIIFSAFWIVQIINFVTGGSLGDLFL